MKKQLFGTCSLWATCIFLLLTSASCSVDERYGLSSNLDATIGVGKGLSIPIGSKSPLQGFSLSPGLISTCLEYKQHGQWSLAVYVDFFTSFPQFSQIKSSFIILNLFICFHLKTIIPQHFLIGINELNIEKNIISCNNSK